MHKLFLFFDTCDDLVERSILVEEKIRIAILELSRALRGQHEQLLAPSRKGKCPDLVISAALEVAQVIHLFLACFVVLTWHIFIPFWLEYVAGMVSNCWEGFDGGLGYRSRW